MSKKNISGSKIKPCKGRKQGRRPLVLLSFDPPVLWSSGPPVVLPELIPGPLVLWSPGPLVPWSSGALVLWFPGPPSLVLCGLLVPPRPLICRKAMLASQRGLCSRT